MTKPAESEEFSHASPKRGARATVRTLQRDAAGRFVAARAKTGGAAKSRRDAKSPRPVADSTVRGLARLQRLAAEQGIQVLGIGRLAPGQGQPGDVGAEGLGQVGEAITEGTDGDGEHALAR